MLLIGCVVLPSGYNEQRNGRPRPESLVGGGKRDVVRPGKTDIGDALVAVAGLVDSDWESWYVDADTRRIAVFYDLTTSVTYFPLCGWPSERNSDERLIVFTVDSNGNVERAETSTLNHDSAFATDYVRSHHDAFLTLVPESSRARLHAAGVIPDDATIRSRRDVP